MSPGHEGVHIATVVPGHLQQNVSSGAETVDAESTSAPRHAVRAVADESGAQERRRVHVVVRVKEGEGDARVRRGVLGVPAVTVTAGEPRVPTKVLLARGAVHTRATHVAQPQDADSHSDVQVGHDGADRGDAADDLVAGDQRNVRGSSPSTRCV
jgi:hypothetical protein